MFSLGQVLTTTGAHEALERARITSTVLINRHRAGDWGDIHPGDIGLNEEALETGARIFSVYRLHTGEKIWVITEADRSSTTLLLPSEY